MLREAVHGLERLVEDKNVLGGEPVAARLVVERLAVADLPEERANLVEGVDVLCREHVLGDVVLALDGGHVGDGMLELLGELAPSDGRLQWSRRATSDCFCLEPGALGASSRRRRVDDVELFEAVVGEENVDSFVLKVGSERCVGCTVARCAAVESRVRSRRPAWRGAPTNCSWRCGEGGEECGEDVVLLRLFGAIARPLVVRIVVVEGRVHVDGGALDARVLQHLVESGGGHIPDKDDFARLVYDDATLEVVVRGGLVKVVPRHRLVDGSLGGGDVDGGDAYAHRPSRTAPSAVSETARGSPRSTRT